MSSIELISELAAWRNFTRKEETPDRIVFELWDRSKWEKIAKGINRENLFGNLKTIALLVGGSIILLFVVPSPWGIVSSATSLVLIILFAVFQSRRYRKTKLTTPPCAIFDRNTGLVQWIDMDYSTFNPIPWQLEIRHIHSLLLEWDDPRFDLAMLQLMDADHAVLHAVFGRSNELRKSADDLRTWLQVDLQDELKPVH